MAAPNYNNVMGNFPSFSDSDDYYDNDNEDDNEDDYSEHDGTVNSDREYLLNMSPRLTASVNLEFEATRGREGMRPRTAHHSWQTAMDRIRDFTPTEIREREEDRSRRDIAESMIRTREDQGRRRGNDVGGSSRNRNNRVDAINDDGVVEGRSNGGPTVGRSVITRGGRDVRDVRDGRQNATASGSNATGRAPESRQPRSQPPQSPYQPSQPPPPTTPTPPRTHVFRPLRRPELLSPPPSANLLPLPLPPTIQNRNRRTAPTSTSTSTTAAAAAAAEPRWTSNTAGGTQSRQAMLARDEAMALAMHQREVQAASRAAAAAANDIGRRADRAEVQARESRDAAIAAVAAARDRARARAGGAAGGDGGGGGLDVNAIALRDFLMWGGVGGLPGRLAGAAAVAYEGMHDQLHHMMMQAYGARMGGGGPPSVEELWKDINFKPRSKSKARSGFTFDFEKDADNEIIGIDLDEDEQAGLKSSTVSQHGSRTDLVCAGCTEILRTSQGQKTQDDRVYALTCGHLIDQRCLHRLMIPAPDPIPLEGAEIIGAPIEPAAIGNTTIEHETDHPWLIGTTPSRATRSQTRRSSNEHPIPFFVGGPKRRADEIAAPRPAKRGRGTANRRPREYIWNCPVASCAREYTSKDTGGVWVPKAGCATPLFV